MSTKIDFSQFHKLNLEPLLQTVIPQPIAIKSNNRLLLIIALVVVGLIIGITIFLIHSNNREKNEDKELKSL